MSFDGIGMGRGQTQTTWMVAARWALRAAASGASAGLSASAGSQGRGKTEMHAVLAAHIHTGRPLAADGRK